VKCSGVTTEARHAQGCRQDLDKINTFSFGIFSNMKFKNLPAD